MILFLNGPPGCGKDTVGRILERDHGATLYKFAAPLRAALCGLLSIEDGEVELVKHKVLSPYGETGRDLMIKLSETIVKPLLGDGWFGERCGHAILCDNPDLCVVTDAGFVNEVSACLEVSGRRGEAWHIRRPCCTFSGDSRNWVYAPNVPIQRLRNDGSIEDLEREVQLLLTCEEAPAST